MIDVGGIVKPRPEYAIKGIEYGYGVITDLYEDDFGTVYCEVVWPGADTTWWSEHELEVISASR